jgi:hypothetical protein
MTRMAPAPAFGPPACAGFGMGSVGEGGSVGGRKMRYVSSNYLNEISWLAALKIRVSPVRFRPRSPLPNF